MTAAITMTPSSRRIRQLLLCSLLLLLSSSANAFTGIPRRTSSSSHAKSNLHQRSDGSSLGNKDLDPSQQQRSSYTPASLTALVVSNLQTLSLPSGYRYSFPKKLLYSPFSSGKKSSILTSSWETPSFSTIASMLPMLLCLVPVYTVLATASLPATPEFWKLVDISRLYDAALPLSAAVGFLGSNLSFFVGGAYLHKTGGGNNAALGNWVWAAGLMSTLFHTVQVAGSYELAEALCYLDHGIALTAGMQFFRYCGMPNIKVCVLGIASLITLAWPISSTYAGMHSLWHVLSAWTAYAWATQEKSSSSVLSTSSSLLKKKNKQKQQRKSQSLREALLRTATSSSSSNASS